jgi:hypothetical protein
MAGIIEEHVPRPAKFWKEPPAHSRRSEVMISRAAWTAAIVVGVATLLLGACGTDATGIEACRKVETLRCKKAPNCQIDLDIPLHKGESQGSDIDGCVRWYNDACLHGVSGGDPGAPALQACVDALTAGDCNMVLHPESHPACAWLIPPNAPDAGQDAGPDAADAADGD